MPSFVLLQVSPNRIPPIGIHTIPKQIHNQQHPHISKLIPVKLIRRTFVRTAETVALMRGPVQYVALNPTRDLSKDRLQLPSSLKPSDPQSFTESYEGRQIVFVPLHHIQNETYTTYFTRA